MAIADEDLRHLGFGIEVSMTDELALVELAGELDLSTAPELRECLAQPEVLDSPAVHIDLVGVTFLDSSSIGLLVAACRRVRSAGGAFSVTCGEGIALRVLEISGLVEFFALEDAT